MTRTELLEALQAERLNTDWWTSTPTHLWPATDHARFHGRQRATEASREATQYETRNRKASA